MVVHQDAHRRAFGYFFPQSLDAGKVVEIQAEDYVGRSDGPGALLARPLETPHRLVARQPFEKSRVVVGRDHLAVMSCPVEHMAQPERRTDRVAVGILVCNDDDIFPPFG